MSHPTIHPAGDGYVEIRVGGRQIAVLPDRDAETLGQALADCPYADEYADGSQCDPPAGAARSAAQVDAGDRPAPGVRCQRCGTRIEWVADAAGGYWRHVGPDVAGPHAAAPPPVWGTSAQLADVEAAGGTPRAIGDTAAFVELVVEALRTLGVFGPEAARRVLARCPADLLTGEEYLLLLDQVTPPAGGEPR